MQNEEIRSAFFCKAATTGRAASQRRKGGIETAAHLREKSRIVLMFCAFDGPPRIVRLHGHGTVLMPGDAEFENLRKQFPGCAGVRCLIHIEVTCISDACGYGVPLFEFVGNRTRLPESLAAKGDVALVKYRKAKNSVSVDGLAGI